MNDSTTQNNKQHKQMKTKTEKVIVIAKDKDAIGTISKALNIEKFRSHFGFNAPAVEDENGNPISRYDDNGKARTVYNDAFASEYDRIVTGLFPMDRLVGNVVEYANNYPRLHFTRIAVLGVKDEAAFKRLKETKEFQEAFGTKEESRVGRVQSSEDIDF